MLWSLSLPDMHNAAGWVILMQMLCLQGLEDPEEQMLGPFIYPNLPQEGEQFQVRVKHLLTPNEVTTNNRDNIIYLKMLCTYSSTNEQTSFYWWQEATVKIILGDKTESVE